MLVGVKSTQMPLFNLRDLDKYILAPELDRNTVKGIITKGFTHFKRIAGIDENKCFKELRTTYISRHRAKLGDRGLTAIISDHSNTNVVDKHYTAQIEAIKKSINSGYSLTMKCASIKSFRDFPYLDSLPHKFKGIKKVSAKH